MPPVLDISLAELTGRAEEQVLAQQARLGVDERHHVLQLVAETEGAARLVESAPRPETARQSLVQEPAVSQDVDGLVGRFDVAPRPACGSSTAIPLRARRGRQPIPENDPTRLRASSASRPTPSVKTISRSCPSARLERNLDRGTRVQAPPRPCRKAGTASWRPDSRSVPLRPRNSVRSPVTVRLRSSHVEKGDPVGELRVVGVAREQGAAVRGRFR